MPSPRPRVVVRGRFPTVYLPKEYMVWKEQLAESVKAHAERPTTEERAGHCTVFMVARVTKPRTSKLAHPGPDVDNYAKGVMDAVTQAETHWEDDKQVTDMRIVKRWATEDEAPGFYVTITYN